MRCYEYKSMALSFSCLRCGRCCTNLIVKIQKDVHAGLALFPDEITYFPKELIFPYRGVGLSPESADFKVVMFRLDVDVCPYLKYENDRSECGIYESHPLACRCFPFYQMSILESRRLNYLMDVNCKAIQILRKENPKRSDMLEASVEEESGHILLQRIQSIMKGRIWIWLFDLKSKSWKSPYKSDE